MVDYTLYDGLPVRWDGQRGRFQKMVKGSKESDEAGWVDMTVLEYAAMKQAAALTREHDRYRTEAEIKYHNMGVRMEKLAKCSVVSPLEILTPLRTREIQIMQIEKRSNQEILTPLRTREVQLQQMEERYRELEAEARLPHNLYPCKTCVYYLATADCTNPLVLGFSGKTKTCVMNGRLPPLCGPEKALWEPRRENQSWWSRLWSRFCTDMGIPSRGDYL